MNTSESPDAPVEPAVEKRVIRSAPLGVLCVVSIAAGSLMTFLFVGGYLGKNYGTGMADGMLGLVGGCTFGFVLGLVMGLWGVPRWDNRQRLLATGLSLVLGAGSFGALWYMVSTTPTR